MQYRVALVSEHASPLGILGGVDSGGQNVYVAQLARRLSSMGHEVDVFTRRDHPDQAEVHDWVDGVRVVHVPAGPPEFVHKEDLLPHIREFADYVIDFCRWRGPYDLMHANFFMSGLVCAEVKAALGTPFVVTFHALGKVRRQHQRTSDGFPDDRFDIEQRVVAEADAIVAECPQDERDLIELYSADRSRIHMIPCGFDPDEMWPVGKAASRRELGIGDNERVVLQLGRMVPRKGVETVVRGFARMAHDAEKPSRLIVVGGETDTADPRATPEIARLLKIAEEEGVGDSVHFVGRKGRERLRYYYSAADVFVTVPWYEPFGITPLEAMACGSPVIGSDVGGIKYTVLDGETGYLVPPKDPDALADRLTRLFDQPDTLRTLSLNAVRRANRHFTWDRVARDASALYARMIGPSAVNVDRAEELATTLDGGFSSLLRTLERSRTALNASIAEATDAVTACFASGGTVLVCGNGGSAADAQHFAAELVGRFRIPDRAALPALSLNSDTAVLTAWSNDVGYEATLSRQVEAFGGPGDLLFAISTSGRSANLVEALRSARKRGMTSVALLGGDGGTLAPLADHTIIVPSRDTPRIQEVHILVLHLLCEVLDKRFANVRRPSTSRRRTRPKVLPAHDALQTSIPRA